MRMAMRIQASTALISSSSGDRRSRYYCRALAPLLFSPRQKSSTFFTCGRPFSSKFHAPILSNPASMSLSLRASARRRFSSQLEEDFASPEDLRFQSPLKIVEYPDPLLRARNKSINTFDDSLKKLVDEMFDIMYKTDGIGLSAPQVGINVELMVFNPSGERGEGEEIVLVNPIVYKASNKTIR